MRKRSSLSILAFLCIAAMAATWISPAKTGLETKAASKKNVYTAFGDSIAAGYGLEGYSDSQTKAPSDSYQAQVASFLKTTSRNYAVTGDDSNDCLEILDSGDVDADLKKSDVITLSIGSNDLLQPFIERMMKEFDIDAGSIDPSKPMPDIDIGSMTEYYQKIKQLLAELKDDKQLHAQAAAFPKQLQKILALLKEKAPNAEIYVTNIYNPFVSIPGLGETADIYIKEINQAFSANDDDYTLIDVYTPLKENPAYVNVHVDIHNLSDDGISLDPHPSVKGHKKFAQLITNAIQQAHAPKAASINQMKSSRNDKLSAKIKLTKDADKYQLLYADSKNGTYRVLTVTSKHTYKTNSKKLKSNRVYYFKARSLKEINHVIYYGKDSKAYKLAIK